MIEEIEKYTVELNDSCILDSDSLCFEKMCSVERLSQYMFLCSHLHTQSDPVLIIITSSLSLKYILAQCVPVLLMFCNVVKLCEEQIMTMKMSSSSSGSKNPAHELRTENKSIFPALFEGNCHFIFKYSLKKSINDDLKAIVTSHIIHKQEE